jgi:LysM repeat protein
MVMGEHRKPTGIGHQVIRAFAGISAAALVAIGVNSVSYSLTTPVQPSYTLTHNSAPSVLSFNMHKAINSFQAQSPIEVTAAPAQTYTVKAGDTLSAIAQRHHTDWMSLWWANRKLIRNPNAITVGEKLKLTIGRASKRIARLAMKALPKPVQAAVTLAYITPTSPAPVSTGGMSAFEACVEEAESGGDPTAYNISSGASGLFGDLLSTWDSLGLGYPGGAYTAPVSVQMEGFTVLYDRDGASPWDADGCPQKFGLS